MSRRDIRSSPAQGAPPIGRGGKLNPFNMYSTGIIVAVAGQKGGTGKSTLAINLAVEAFVRGYYTALIDADPQRTVETWVAVAREREQPTAMVLPAGNMLRDAAKFRAHMCGQELVIIDCPPRHGEVQRAALLACDRVLVPCGPSSSDVWALAETMRLIDEARGFRPGLVAQLVRTRVQPRTALAESVRSALGRTRLPLLDASCGLRVAYPESMMAGEGVSTFQPRGAAAAEIRRLFDELLPDIGCGAAKASK